MEGSNILGDGEPSTNQLLNSLVSNQDQLRMKERVRHYFTGSKMIKINKQIISSYNELITNGIMDVFLAHNQVSSNSVMLKFSNAELGTPVYKDIRLQENAQFVRTSSYSRMRIGMIPVMVRGMNCVADDVYPEDLGGYFIIKGQKKIICLHENPVVPNQMVVQAENGRKTCKVVSVGSKSQGASSPPRSEMMPHLAFEADESVTQEDALEKSLLATARFICLMARTLIQNEQNPSTSINLRTSRIDLPGLTMGALFEKLFSGFSNEMMNRVVEQGSLLNLDDIITLGFDAAMLTGKWELDGYLLKVTETLPSDSFASATKSMMQIRGTLLNEPGVGNPYLRQADDQTDCTLLKQLNVLTSITSRSKEGPIKAVLFSNDYCLPISEGSFSDYHRKRVFLGEVFLPEYDVFLNGKFIGFTCFSFVFAEEFRAERRRGSIPYTVSVYVDDRTRSIAIFSDSGRLTRPYIRVENGAPVAMLDEICQHLEENADTAVKKLIAEGIIEFLDGYERENCVIVSQESDITESTTHLELPSPLRPGIPTTSGIV